MNDALRLIAVPGLAAVILAGCGGDDEQPEENVAQEETTAEESTEDTTEAEEQEKAQKERVEQDNKIAEEEGRVAKSEIESALVPVEVVEVLDASTVVINRGDGAETMRMLHIETGEPDDESFDTYGMTAFNHTQSILMDRPDVFFEPGQPEVDADGNLVGYIWIEERHWYDNMSEYLLSEGLARYKEEQGQDSPHEDRLQAAVEEAKAEEKNIWFHTQ